MIPSKVIAKLSGRLPEEFLRAPDGWYVNKTQTIALNSTFDYAYWIYYVIYTEYRSSDIEVIEKVFDEVSL